jgi:YD repeat-containing protein
MVLVNPVATTLIDKVTLPDGRYVQYGYTSGRLTTVRDPRGKSWSIGYDGNGRLTSIQDPAGHYQLQNVQYDGQGRVTEIARPAESRYQRAKRNRRHDLLCLYDGGRVRRDHGHDPDDQGELRSRT